MKEELARKIGELADALRETDEYKRLLAARKRWKGARLQS